MSTLREHLRALRLARNLTVPEAAALIGIHEPTLYGLEGGSVAVGRKRLGAVLDAYQASEAERTTAALLWTSDLVRPPAA